MRVKGENYTGKAISIVIALMLCAAIAGCGSGASNTAASGVVTPSVATITPNAAPAGALAFTLTVTGSNFSSASTVNWNGSSRTTTFVSNSQLQAHIMAADLASPGKVSVTVVTSGAPTSAAATFTVAPDTIVYQSNRALDGSDNTNGDASNIWVANPDGSGQAALTKYTVGTAPVFQPAWSTEGSRIAFSSTGALDGSNAPNTSNSVANIWVVKPDGTGLTPLTKLTAFNSDGFSPAWSPDGSKIAFISGRALDGTDAANTNHTQNIWVVNADGSSPTPLTKLTALVLTTPPVWSPDGKKIAFASARALDGSDNASTTLNIWVMNADGSGLTPLTNLTAISASSQTPSWSPDGSKLAFASRRALDGSNAVNPNSTLNIWIVNTDGSNAHVLTQMTAASSGCFQPVWSPDGSKLVFFSARALDGSNAAIGAENIWVMNADGSSPTPVTQITAFGDSTNAVWTPDGAKILYTSARPLDGTNGDNISENIWLMNADGSNAVPLTSISFNTTLVTSDLASQP